MEHNGLLMMLNIFHVRLLSLIISFIFNKFTMFKLITDHYVKRAKGVLVVDMILSIFFIKDRYFLLNYLLLF